MNANDIIARLLSVNDPRTVALILGYWDGDVALARRMLRTWGFMNNNG